MGEAIGPLNKLFRSQDEIVEIKDEPFTAELYKNKSAKSGLTFSVLTPARSRTWVEDFVTTGIYEPINPNLTPDGRVSPERKFVPHSMSSDVACSLMQSPQFAREIPQINRILDVPIPIKSPSGEIITLGPGFNSKLGIYCDPNAPPICKMSFEEALEVLSKTLEGFCFKNEQSRVHAIARLLTPYGRGIIGFSKRTPLWFFLGNRPRAGKDYCAGISQITYLGQSFEDAALGRNSEEIGKRITCALRAGRRQMHFANNQDPINAETFIQAITAEVWRDRALGSTSAKSDVKLKNEIDYSVSGNVGITYREDVEPRARFIELEYHEENENDRRFPNVYLHEWVLDQRSLVLSAIHAFFQRWIDRGMPPGKTPFSSFPKWAAVIGGVMQTCGLGDPCLPREAKGGSPGGDLKTAAMRELYSLVYSLHPNEWINKQKVYEIIADNQETNEHLSWFGDFSGVTKQKAKTTAGRALSTFNKRQLGGVELRIDSSDANPSRHRIMFAKL
jgi:hypothetical protein